MRRLLPCLLTCVTLTLLCARVPLSFAQDDDTDEPAIFFPDRDYDAVPDPKWLDAITDPQALFAAGTQASMDRRADEAIACFRRFLALHADHALAPDALYALGHAYESSERCDLAVQAWRALLRSFPKWERAEDACARIAQSFADRAQRQSDENARVRQQLDEAIQTELLRLPLRGTADEQKAARDQVAAKWNALADAGLRLADAFQRQAIDAYRRVVDRFPNGRRAMDAAIYLARVDRPDIQAEVGHPYRSLEPITLSLRHGHVGDALVRVFRLDSDALERRAVERGNADLRDLIAFSDVPAQAQPVLERKLHLWHQEDGKVDLALGKLPAGVYVVSFTESYFRAWCPLLVTDLAAVQALAGPDSAVFALDSATGAPMTGGKLFAFPRADEEQTKRRIVPEPVRAEFDADGIARFALPALGAGVLVRCGEHFATTEGSWRTDRGDAAEESARNFVYTDRPIYRPGQRVCWRAILRRLSAGELTLPQEAAVVVRLRDARGNVIGTERLAPDGFGCVSGAFEIAADGETGTFSIDASTGGRATFKVEAYRLPSFALHTRPVREMFVQGEPVEIGLAAEYFFGRPVAGAEVSFSGYTTCPFAVHPALRSPRVLSRHWSVEGGRVRPDSCRTDAEGHGTVRFDARPLGDDVMYGLSVKVVDRSRREVRIWAQVPVYAGSVALALEADGSPEAGKGFSFAARAVHLDGKPAAGLPVSVEITRVRWVDRKETEETFLKLAAKTGEDGVATYSVPACARGLLRLRASATDPEGRTVAYAGDLAIGGWYRGKSEAPEIELTLDAETYDVGQEAALGVRSGIRDGAVYLVLGTCGLERVQRVNLLEGAAQVRIPVEARIFPGTGVQVAAVRDGKLVRGGTELRISPRRRALNVGLSLDREQYGIGEQARCRIRVTDADGRPVVAQVSLAAVDEAIYGLAEDASGDLLAQFHRLFVSRPRWRDSFTFEARMHLEFAIPFGAGGGGGGAFGGRFGGRQHLVARGGGSMATETAFRREFPETLYWNAAVTTDADGLAEVEIPTADAITTYRLLARAVTADTRAGAARSDLRVDREFFVQLTAPRHFVPGDRCAVTGVVHGTGGSTDMVQLTLEADGASIDGPAERRLTAAAAASGRVDWFVKVGETERVVLRCRASSAGRADAMEVTVPVLPFGPARAGGVAGRCEPRAEEKVMLARNDRFRARSVRISISGGKAGPVLDALQYLAGYPYGCVEQTLSRFLPSVACRHALEASGSAPGPAFAELPRMVALGLQRVYALQHHDGAWGWWTSDGDDGGKTAYVLRSLRTAQALGVPVDPAVIERGRNWLLKATEKETDAMTLAAAAAAVAGKDVGSQDLLDRAWAARENLPDTGRAFLIEALVQAGRTEQAAAEADRLRTAATGPGRGAFWRGHGSRTSWYESDVEATAEAVRALLAVDAQDPLAARAVDYLLGVKRGGNWGSTRATSAAALACTTFLGGASENDAHASCRVSWNGRALHDGPLARANEQPVQRIAVPDDLLHNGSNELEIVAAGRGPVFYDVTWVEDDLASSFEERSSGGVDVRRSYHRVRRTEDKDVADEAPMAAGETVPSGEEIEVRIAIDSVRDYEYVLLEDPKPAGFEWSCWQRGPGCHEEARDDRMAFVFARLPEGVNEIRYRLRAESPGAFRIGPAQLTHMYSDRLFSLSASGALKVE